MLDHMLVPVAVTTPTESEATSEVNIGLLMQYHYVGLNKLSVVPSPNDISNDEQSSGTQMDTNADVSLDDGTIEDGDEHIRQITGGPVASMMSIENPEAIVCVAPAEGERPLSIMTDPNFETLTNSLLVLDALVQKDPIN